MSLSSAYGPVTDTRGLAVIAAARDAGVNFFDTANIYGDGRSEQLLGRAFLRSSERDAVVLATKFGIVRGAGPGRRGIRGDRAYVFEQVDASLRRLGTDRIDLLYQHRVDREVGIEETVGAMSELVSAGKVRFLGLSEASGSEIARANAIHPISAVQSEWNALSRDVEANVIPTLSRLGIPLISYAPLSRALLTGKVQRQGYVPPDIRSNFPRFAADAIGPNLALVAELGTHATRLGSSPGQLALAWLEARSVELGVTCIPIPGTRSTSHLRENLAATGLKLPEETKQLLDGFALRVKGPRNADLRCISQGRD